MTTRMKLLFPVLLSLVALSPIKAAMLSDVERQEILEKLKTFREAADAKVDARFRMAINAYNTAAASDQAAMELYLNSVEKVDFKDQHKKAADFRDWKRKEDDKLSATDRGMALRLQLRWLILTLRSASSNTDRESLLPSVQEIVDTVAREAGRLKPHRQILNQSVLSSAYAKAYTLGAVELKNWPLAPGQIGQIYDQILMPPLRRQDRVAALRSIWIRRIQQEMSMQEARGAKEEPEKESRRVGTVDSQKSSDYEVFVAETVPEMQWQMEVDLFKHGDQQASAVRMLTHLEKYSAHKSVLKWSQELADLLNPVVEVVTPLK